MDNEKTGQLIKERRLEKGYTQKDLADKLGITDRAVSKWERGLSAPDIALLEPLAEALDVSVLEIIHGERNNREVMENNESVPTRDVIEYAIKELKIKMRKAVKRVIAVVMAIAILVAGACVYNLWRNGHFNIVMQSTSPDGDIDITVYNKDWKTRSGLTQKEHCTFIVVKDGKRESWFNYGKLKCTYLEWSYDSSECLLAFRDGGIGLSYRYELIDVKSGTVMTLNDLINDGIKETEKIKNGYEFDAANVDGIICLYSGWQKNMETMIFSYYFTDESGYKHNGAFNLNYGSYICTPIDAEFQS